MGDSSPELVDHCLRNAASSSAARQCLLGRITSRTEGTTVIHYGFGGPGDSRAFTMDASNQVTERTIGLIGGVMVTKRGGPSALATSGAIPTSTAT